MFSTGFTSPSVLLLFSLLITFFVFVHSFWFYFIYRWGSLDQPIWKCVCLSRFNVHHNDWLTYSGGTDRSGELCYNFSVSNDLTQMVNFPTWIPDCDSHSPALLDIFLSSDASMSYNGLPSIGKFWSCCCLSFHWLSIMFLKECPVWLFSCWLGRYSWSFKRRSMGGYL